MQDYYGKLSPECLAELDSLLLKLKEANKCHEGKKIIHRDEIVPLPDEEYLKLWEYLRHCCLLVASWPNKRKAISIIAEKRGVQVDEVRDECVDSMTIHCYVYAWRKYQHSTECNYVFATAKFGYQTWIEEQQKFYNGVDVAVEEARLQFNGGKRVFNVNIMD